MAQNKIAALLRDVAQGASNSVAEGVSAPVDGIAWLLRKAGLPIPAEPVGGSDWMARQGLTAKPTNALAGGVGEFLGMTTPAVVAAKAPQVANALLKMQANAAAPRTINPQAGVLAWHGTMTPGFEKFSRDHFGRTDGGWLGQGVYGAESKADASAYATINNKPGGAVYRVDMDIKKPLVIDWHAPNRPELLAKRRELGPNGFTEWLRAQGFDGVHFLGPKSAVNSVGDRDVQYMAIDPAQVGFASISAP